MLISTDKAVSPINLYGATKLIKKLFISLIFLKCSQKHYLVLQDMVMYLVVEDLWFQFF